jgi:hypothetical protein
MPTTELNLTTVALSELRPDPANPRTHDARNIAAIAASLREHGQVEPLLVQRSTMMVIGGNGRAEAMRSLGWKQARVALLDVSDTEARKLSIALNRTGELAGWDEAVLARHLADLSALDGFVVEDLGFNTAELDALVAAYVGEVDQMHLEEPPPRDTSKLPINQLTAAQTDQPASPVTSSVMPATPEHTVPAPMPTSSVRLVQLFLDDETIDGFQMAVRKLADQYVTDNITDTVRRAVLTAAGDWKD